MPLCVSPRLTVPYAAVFLEKLSPDVAQPNAHCMCSLPRSCGTREGVSQSQDVVEREGVSQSQDVDRSKRRTDVSLSSSQATDHASRGKRGRAAERRAAIRLHTAVVPLRLRALCLVKRGDWLTPHWALSQGARARVATHNPGRGPSGPAARELDSHPKSDERTLDAAQLAPETPHAVAA
jgi:hypothetical protein